MDLTDYTMGHQIARMLPAAAFALAAGGAWLIVCRFLLRRQDVSYAAQLLKLDEMGESIAATVAARRLAGKGRPSDRLFIGGLMAAGVCALAALVGIMFV